MLRSWLRRMGNRHLLKRLEEQERKSRRLTGQLDAAKEKFDDQAGVIQYLREIIARDRSRVKAETQIHAQVEASARKAK